jgi:hypothetical protein
MFFPEPNFSIPDPGSKRFRFPDPGSGSASKNLSIFNPKTKVSEKLSGIFIPYTDFFHPGSRGQKRTEFQIRIRNTDESTLILFGWMEESEEI